MMNKKQNNNAGRQAHADGNPLGFRTVAASGARPLENPVPWVWLLQLLGRGGLRLRIGNRAYRLSSDTIYFLEETGSAAGDREPLITGDDTGDGLFTYVCGTLDAVVTTLEDLRRAAGAGPVQAEGVGGIPSLVN